MAVADHCFCLDIRTGVFKLLVDHVWCLGDHHKQWCGSKIWVGLTALHMLIEKKVVLGLLCSKLFRFSQPVT